MNITTLTFLLLSALGVLSATMIVLSKNPVHSVLWLVMVFFSISGHYVMLNAQFLAVVNIIVYAGAIMVLFLFVVMLMNLNAESEPRKNYRLRLVGIISGGSLMLVVVSAIRNLGPQAVQMKIGNAGLVKALGAQLFHEYVFPFEISSVLFLSAIIGAVVISKKETSTQESH
jgi:NADH-quinone oxidoreductase subunit J